MRAGAVTIGLLREGIQVQIMRAMAGGFKALNMPEGYVGESRPGRPPGGEPRRAGEAEQPHDPEFDRKYAITPAGLARLPTADSIELWLLKASRGTLPYDDRRSRESIDLLSEVWGKGIAHRLAIGPATADELLEAGGLPRRRGLRVLKGLRRVGLIERGAHAGGHDVYLPTEWLRRAVAPILRAAEVEYHDPPEDGEPFDAVDFEAAMLLAVPLARCGEGRSGRCRLVARIGDRGHREPAGVTVEVEDGAIVACERGLDPDAPGESSGLATAWFRALSQQRPSLLRHEGDKRLARDLVAAVAWTLFDEQAYAH